MPKWLIITLKVVFIAFWGIWAAWRTWELGRLTAKVLDDMSIDEYEMQMMLSQWKKTHKTYKDLYRAVKGW